ncbi:hypothetical protein [Streptomyces sp. SLBN-118]|uniref:hypothetical protein n=1 Tax=Streptomyces sp. SLBN-118 TaxID=2768454 RepID=UPI0011548DA3|nr:hypothetical protein [Streptomyces sp. SLBN-118]
MVLKEARPHAGLAADGADGVTRLERERAALAAVAGRLADPDAGAVLIDGVPLPSLSGECCWSPRPGCSRAA